MVTFTLFAFRVFFTRAYTRARTLTGTYSNNMAGNLFEIAPC
jgi:hypothetical protein